MSRAWDASILGCLGDIPSYCYIFCSPCGFICTHLQVSTKASGEFCRVCLRVFLCCYFGCAVNRKIIRQELGVSGTYLGDCFAWYLCAPCAASQEYREWIKYNRRP